MGQKIPMSGYKKRRERLQEKETAFRLTHFYLHSLFFFQNFTAGHPRTILNFGLRIAHCLSVMITHLIAVYFDPVDLLQFDVRSFAEFDHVSTLYHWRGWRGAPVRMKSGRQWRRRHVRHMVFV